MTTTFAHLSDSSTYVVGLTANASGNTKGTYAQISSSTPFNISHFWLWFNRESNSGRYVLADIATGAAASEVVQIANVSLQCGDGGGRFADYDVEVWMDIASGTRIAARIQADVGSTGIFLAIYAESSDLLGYAAPTTYGANTGNSQSVNVDAGGTANTKGSYAQITASTTATHDGWVILIGCRENAVPTASSVNIDIATGAAASEVVWLPDIAARWETNGDLLLPCSLSVPKSITSGTRIASRCCSTTNDATDRIIQIEMIGMSFAA